MEFASIEDERRYFARHGMRLEAAEEEVVLDRGELLVFDNLVIAHGRRGARHEMELHQLCIGFRSLDHADQAKLLERVLGSFDRADQTGGVAAL
jgi:NADH dehydrogenase FAD-containing subunit